MNETINLMNAHTSVRRFTEKQISDKELRAIINAGRAASSWKNFQSYSIIVVRSKEKKRSPLWLGAPRSHSAVFGFPAFCWRPQSCPKGRSHAYGRLLS